MSSLASADITRLAEALRRTAEQSGTTTQEVLITGANYIKAEMESRVPVDTRNLHDSIGIVVTSNSVKIGPDVSKAPYALYVELGTKKHVIEPKNKGGVLRFTIGNRVIYATKVNHPGTKAQPYILPSFMAWVDSLGTLAAEANVEVFRKHA